MCEGVFFTEQTIGGATAIKHLYCEILCSTMAALSCFCFPKRLRRTRTLHATTEASALSPAERVAQVDTRRHALHRPSPSERR